MHDRDLHYRFLAACLRDRSCGTSNGHLSATISPAVLIRIADEQLVLPVVHYTLQTLGLSRQLPPEAREFLATLESLNHDRNRLLLSEVKSIAKLLNQHGIEPILLKGAAYLVADVYQNLADRLIGDIDLLIAERQYSVAIELLVSAGYRREESDPVGIFRHHHPPLRSPQSALVEIHHSLASGGLAHFLTRSEIVASSSAHEFEGVRVRIPSPDHLIIHHILHSQLYGYYSERIWPSLRCMLDLILLERRFGTSIDWAAIEARFRRNRKYHALVLYLKHVEQILGMPSPISIDWNPALKLHGLNRKLVRAYPLMRLIDPDLYTSIFGRRARLLGAILRAPEGWKVLTKAIFDATFYHHLLVDFRKDGA